MKPVGGFPHGKQIGIVQDIISASLTDVFHIKFDDSWHFAQHVYVGSETRQRWLCELGECLWWLALLALSRRRRLHGGTSPRKNHRRSLGVSPERRHNRGYELEFWLARLRIKESGRNSKHTAKNTWIDLTMAPKKKRAVHNLGQDIQHAVKDGFGIRCDHISTLGESPGDGIQKPQEDQVHANGGVCLGYIWTQGARMLASSYRNDICDPEQCNATEDKVAPLTRLVSILLRSPIDVSTNTL